MIHQGERAVRLRAGESRPGRGAPVFGPEIEPGFAQLMRGQRMVVIGSADEDGDVWATILTGPVGFVNPTGPTSIAFAALPVTGGPLWNAFGAERACGTLAVDLLSCRRVRANGRMRRDDGRLIMRTDQVLRNCAKYIQRRRLVADADPVHPTVTTGVELTARQRDWIAGADTFFIASHSPAHGADASHRGGRPGFVTAEPRRLSWPDYAGNSFFMTLGNLELNSACGLLFLDWEQGHTLHLTGSARVDWETRSAPGARRTVRFAVERVVQVDNATALRWKLIEYSCFNP